MNETKGLSLPSSLVHSARERGYRAVIALLVERLGGDVEVEQHEVLDVIEHRRLELWEEEKIKTGGGGYSRAVRLFVKEPERPDLAAEERSTVRREWFTDPDTGIRVRSNGSAAGNEFVRLMRDSIAEERT